MHRGEWLTELARIRTELLDAVARWEQFYGARVTDIRFYRNCNNLPEIEVEGFSDYEIDGVPNTRIPRRGPEK